MKNTGKKICGVPVWTDPGVPPNQIFLLHDDIKNTKSKLNAKLINVNMEPKQNKKTVRRVIGCWLVIKMWPQGRTKPYIGYRFAIWLCDGGY